MIHLPVQHKGFMSMIENGRQYVDGKNILMTTEFYEFIPGVFQLKVCPAV